MIEALRYWGPLTIGVILAGVLATFAAPALALHTGAPGTGVLHAAAPGQAALALLGVFAALLVIAAAVGWAVNAAVGLFTLGAGLFVLALRTGSLRHVAFAELGLAAIVVELLLWSALLLAAALIVFNAAGPLRDIEPAETGRHPHPLLSRDALLQGGAGVLVLLLVWIFGQSPLKGQMLAATILGSTAAGLAGRLLSPHVQPILLFAAPCFFGALGHIAGVMLLPGRLADAFVAGAVPALNMPMPIDYAAGSLIGVAFGLGWARSFLHHEEG